jgi:hypothetical protein
VVAKELADLKALPFQRMTVWLLVKKDVFTAPTEECGCPGVTDMKISDF